MMVTKMNDKNWERGLKTHHKTRSINNRPTVTIKSKTYEFCVISIVAIVVRSSPEHIDLLFIFLKMILKSIRN